MTETGSFNVLTKINCSKAQNKLADCQHHNMKCRHRLEFKNNAMCDVNKKTSAEATAATPPKNKVLHALAIIRQGLN